MMNIEIKKPWALWWLKRKDVLAVAVGVAIGSAIDGPLQLWAYVTIGTLAALFAIVDHYAGLPSKWGHDET